MMRLVSLSLVMLCTVSAQGVREKRVTPVDKSEAQDFQKEPKVALVVGVANYPSASGFPALTYAAQDVKDIGAALSDRDYTVSVLTDSEATRGSILRMLRQVVQSVQSSNGTLLFYFSGHGFSVDGKAYLAPVSASVDDLEREGLAVSEVEQIMASSKAQRKIMMLDACRSQSKEKGAGGRSFSSLEAARGFKILNSTKMDQVSYESDDLRHGVFSAFVLKALRGEAARDDGLVTFNDLSGYVSESMRNWGIEHHVVQVPYERTDGEVSGDFLLAASVPVAPLAKPQTKTETPLLRRANELYASNRYAQALPLYQQAAISDDQAMLRLGMLYYAGHGVARDYPQALSWFHKAADAGNSKAKDYIGTMYLNGLGVEQNFQQAVPWLRMAAGDGDADAMEILGMLYRDGKGVEQSSQQSMIWLRKADESGSAKAMDDIGELYQIGLGVPQDYQQAMSWYKKAADAGNSNGMKDIGRLYADGKGVTRDDKQAEVWFRKAANAGNLIAMNNLGWLYEHGLGLTQDYQQAMVWYRRAADGRYPTAMDNLGRLYENAIGVSKNRDQAIDWYRQAAALGDEQAKTALKHMGVHP